MGLLIALQCWTLVKLTQGVAVLPVVPSERFIAGCQLASGYEYVQWDRVYGSLYYVRGMCDSYT